MLLNGVNMLMTSAPSAPQLFMKLLKTTQDSRLHRCAFLTIEFFKNKFLLKTTQKTFSYIDKDMD